MGIVVISGKHMWCNGSTLAPNARAVGLSPTLGTVFPIFITPMILVAMTMDPVQAMQCMVVDVCMTLVAVTMDPVQAMQCMVVDVPWPCVYMAIACMYVVVCITILTIPGGTSVVVYTDL